MSEAISKFQPHRTMYVRGFDRRGCIAAMHSASSGGFTVSGQWSDVADFAVLVLFDADDLFGHLQTTKYLPHFDLTDVVVEFDCAITNGMYPGSTKFQSVPWGMLSWIKEDGERGTTALDITSTSGGVAASTTFTLAGTPTTFDRVQIVYLGNVVFDALSITSGQSLADVAADIAALINGATSPTVPLTATSSGPDITITCTQPGEDGNTIELLGMYKTAGNTSISPARAKLTGGVNPTSFHVELDFTGMDLASLRQCWLTLAPNLPINSETGADDPPTLVAFEAKEFEYAFSNWTVTDPEDNTPLKVAGAGSVLVGNADRWARYAGSWTREIGAFYHGFARRSSTAGDTVTVRYICAGEHDLYLGTVLADGHGEFEVSLDGDPIANRPTALEGALSDDTPVAGRRLLASAVAGGEHTVVLTLADAADTWFDYLHALIPSDVEDPAVTYDSINAAWDYDTDQTYKLAPARALWISQKLGFEGDLDFYAGVFFALKRTRVGGFLHQATVTLGGSFSSGSGFGDGDAIFVDIGGTAFGCAVFPADTLATLARRLVNGINGLFVGVHAEPTETDGEFTITTISPINGFDLEVTLSMAASGTLDVAGDIAAGNEGIWGADATQEEPLNRGFADYLTDLAGLLQAAGQTMTLAFSQEVLAPPDVDTAEGAWAQRFVDGTPVMTAIGFGTWGAGFVDGVDGDEIEQIGHGYMTGYIVQLASMSESGVWAITVLDEDHYELTMLLAGGYTPGVGDAVLARLQTVHCAFNPETVTPYLEACYVQAAGILAGAGLTPWLQFGETLHWFFSGLMPVPGEGLSQSVPIVGMAESGGLIEFETSAAHGLTNGQTAIVAGAPAGSGTAVVAVSDATHFTNGTPYAGPYSAAGRVTGARGMAFYDANQADAANTTLGRSLATFWTQDDDPSVNDGEDVEFLQQRIYDHISTIVTAVLAAEASAKFELLYPLDVAFLSCYYTAALPYPQGGRLNGEVNLPAQFHQKSGSGLDRIRMEALSWQATYFNHNNHVASVRFPYVDLDWDKADTALLIGWFNGSCPWTAAYLFAANEEIPLINLWAQDHVILESWEVPLPVNEPSVRMS